MDVNDWPMDGKTWKEEYFNYQYQYRLDVDEEYKINLQLRKFMKNNITLNHILLKAKENPKYINRLQKRVNNYKEQLKEIETEIKNNTDNQEINKLKYKIVTLVSPALLEASEQFLLNQAEQSLAFAKTKRDTTTVRKPTKLSELDPDILSMVQSKMTGKGKRKSKKKRKSKRKKKSKSKKKTRRKSKSKI